MAVVSKKRVLVTGGAGFIGSHLCKRLLDLGDEVICLDNLCTGSERNIEPLRVSSHFKVIYHDVVDVFHVDVDEIYNLACPASPVHYQANPLQTLRTSVNGALHCLNIAYKNSCRVLQASTSEIYGDPHVHPQPESYWGNVNPTGPRACYDEGKRAAETLFFDHHRAYNTNVKVVRIFNTYGPNMHPLDGRVVSNFIVQALQNKDITIYGSGTQTRSFCYVDDMIDGMIRMMATPPSIVGPVNLGNPAEFSVKELADIVVGLTGSRSQVIFGALPVDDPRMRRPDVKRARELLKWVPKVSLRSGLERTIVYFQRLLSSERKDTLDRL